MSDTDSSRRTFMVLAAAAPAALALTVAPSFARRTWQIPSSPSNDAVLSVLWHDQKQGNSR